MSHLTANEATLSQLRGLLRPVEIRDSAGKVLGHYVPVVNQEELYRKAAQLFDLEESERLAQTERGGRPLAEIMAELRASEKPR